MSEHRNTAFTLLEMIAVVIIVGILATIAIPQYARFRERALDQEAISGVRFLQQAQRIFYMENNRYYPAAGADGNINTINANLKLSLSNQSWAFTAASNGVSTAARQGRVWTLTVAGINATCAPPANCF